MVRELIKTLRSRLSTIRVQPAVLLGSNRESRRRSSGRAPFYARAFYLGLVTFLLGIFIVGIPTAFNEMTSGIIGITIRQNNVGEFAVSPISGLPAAEAGVQEGDILIKVNGASLQKGTDIPGLFKLLRGSPSSQILLDVRGLDGTTRQHTITRLGFPLEVYGISTNVYALYLTTLGVTLILGFCIPAFIIFLRRSDDWLAIFVSLTLVVIAISKSRAYAGWFFLPPLLSETINFLYNLSTLLILYIFPDGRFVPRWTRQFLLVGFAWTLWKVLPTSFGMILWTSHMWLVVDFVVFGTGIFAQIFRYRYVSGPQERQQTKWITYGMTIAFLAQYAYSLLPIFVPAISARTAQGLGFSLVGTTIHHLAMLVLPITVTHAVLRRRLYDIDLIINRTLVYVPLSAIVAGTFAAVVTLSKRLFVTLTGETSDMAIVLTTLVVVVMITPVKDWLQTLVDKRFKEVPLPTRILNNFEEQVRKRMFAVDVGPITRRFLEEAVKAFDAESGVAYIEKNGDLRLVHTLGEWKGEDKVSVPVEIGGKKIASIMLGKRRNGRDYTDQDYETLHHISQIVEHAIEEDRKIKI